MPDLKKIIALLKKHYGEPVLPPAHGPFELVLWENACYLLSDERRAAVFEGLRRQVGLTAEAIWQAPQEILLPRCPLPARWQPIVERGPFSRHARLRLSHLRGDSRHAGWCGPGMTMRPGERHASEACDTLSAILEPDGKPG